MEKRRTISHARGRGSMNHNNRVHSYRNVDDSRSHLNISYANESLETAYEKCFGNAQRAYDQKQKRDDRKIHDYYTHLFGEADKNSVANSKNKEQSYYEIVVGIGCKDTCGIGTADGELAARILDEYARGFAERNPNFYVFNSVLHLDERTPHLHIDYVPIATGYKTGMETRNGHAKALEQMGYGNNKNSINEWRKKERDILRELCKAHGLDISEETKGRGHTLTPDEYKKMCNEVKDELRADPDLVDELKGELRHDFIAEHKNLLIQEATEQAAAEIGELNRKLAEETRPRLEGAIASEQRVNKIIDGMREETRGWGSNKKPYTIIEIPNMTNEQALTVLKVAQQSAINAANAKKFKASRDTAVAERDTAVKAKEVAERKQATAEAETQKYKQLYSQAQNSTSELVSKISHQQSEAKRWEGNYNNLYSQHVKLKRSKGLSIE